MLLGLVHINMGQMSQPDILAKAARAAEAAGFDSLWAGEHVVLSGGRVLLASPAPDGPQQTVQAGAEAISGL